MNKEAQPYKKNVSNSLEGDAELPVQKVRPTFVPNPTIQEASGGKETAQRLLNAFDGQIPTEQRRAPGNKNTRQRPRRASP